MYYDIPRIRTFADAEKYFNANKPFVRGWKKGKVPVGNRARGYITMEKVEGGVNICTTRYRISG